MLKLAMKTFDDLSINERETAYHRCLSQLLEQITSGLMRFNDELNENDLQARIDRAINSANALQTPWFAHEYIMDDSFCRECIEGMARVDAEDAYYLLPHEKAIQL